MNSKSRSSLNSELFMKTPVPVRKLESTRDIMNAEQKFYTKGDNHEAKKFEIDNGNDDIIIIKRKDDSLQLHRTALRETLSELKKVTTVAVSNLDPEKSQLLQSIIEVTKALYNTPKLYDLVLKDIATIFHDVKEVVPGTVGAFFVGCFTDDKFPGPQGCNPKCVASVPPTEGTLGFKHCDELVIIYNDGKFGALNEKKSDKAYIYISDENFSGFNADNIKQLKESGVQSASLIFGTANGAYREVTGNLSLDQLPIQINTTSDTQSSSSNAVGIVVFIIIIAIIIALLVYLFYYLPRNQ